MTYCLFYQEDTLSRKEISQEGFEASVGIQFSFKFNLNETSFTELNWMKLHSVNSFLTLTELCYNVKVKEEQALDEITSLVDGWGFVNC